MSTRILPGHRGRWVRQGSRIILRPPLAGGAAGPNLATAARDVAELFLSRLETCKL